MTQDLATLSREMDLLFTRAGLTVPAERQAQVLPAYAELREHLELLRGRPASAEPSNTFRLKRIA